MWGLSGLLFRAYRSRCAEHGSYQAPIADRLIYPHGRAAVDLTTLTLQEGDNASIVPGSLGSCQEWRDTARTAFLPWILSELYLALFHAQETYLAVYLL